MECCVTLESKADKNRYVQFTAEHVNLAYPRSENPKSTLEHLPSFPQCEIANWEAGSFLTLEHGVEQSIEPMGEFVAHYIQNVFNLPAVESDWTSTEQFL